MQFINVDDRIKNNIYDKKWVTESNKLLLVQLKRIKFGVSDDMYEMWKYTEK